MKYLRKYEHKGKIRYVYPSCYKRKTERKVDYLFDEDAFEVLTLIVRYWLGFLYADGCICGYDIQLKLAIIDREHVEAFAYFLNYDGPILEERKKNGNKQVTIKICSWKLASRLMELGVVPNKTFKVFAHPLLTMCVHFWRGVFDGDGSIWFVNGRPRSQLSSASYKFIKQFEVFADSLGAYGSLSCDRGCWRYCLRAASTVTLLYYLYPTDEEIIAFVS